MIFFVSYGFPLDIKFPRQALVALIEDSDIYSTIDDMLFENVNQILLLSGPLSTISNDVSIIVNFIVQHLCDAHEKTVAGCAAQAGVRP